MTATDIVVLFLVLGYIAFLAWILYSSRQTKPKDNAREDEQGTAKRDASKSDRRRKVA